MKVRGDWDFRFPSDSMLGHLEPHERRGFIRAAGDPPPGAEIYRTPNGMVYARGPRPWREEMSRLFYERSVAR